MTPSQIVHHASGSPAVPDCSPMTGRCWLCGGEVARGALVGDWLSDSFPDQTRVLLPASPVICEPCVYVCSRTAAVPGRLPGKCRVCEGMLLVVAIPPAGKGKSAKKGDPCPKCDGTGMQQFGANFRNVSSLYDEHGYVSATKGEKPIIRAFLERRHTGSWFAAIGESGQKHVLPFAAINPPSQGGMVLFEDRLVHVPKVPALIGAMVDLLTDGATKEEIDRGDYHPRSWRDRRPLIEQFEAAHGRQRGSGWFSLALFLAQRDEEEFERRRAARENANADKRPTKKPRNGGRRDAARAPKRVPIIGEREAVDGLLGAATEPHAERGPNHDDGQRVDESGDARNADRQPAQVGLPGIG